MPQIQTIVTAIQRSPPTSRLQKPTSAAVTLTPYRGADQAAGGCRSSGRLTGAGRASGLHRKHSTRPSTSTSASGFSQRQMPVAHRADASRGASSRQGSDLRRKAVGASATATTSVAGGVDPLFGRFFCPPLPESEFFAPHYLKVSNSGTPGRDSAGFRLRPGRRLA
jgi:hypothetical protein